MSLLLEALKKAEKAKEDAQRRAGDSGAGELRLADDVAPAAPAKPVLTRPELPDITAPLEILSEDLATKPAAPEFQPAPSPAPRRPSASAAPGADPQAADRAAARKVFEAKVREPNPRLPFFIAMGSLGAFAVGTIIYFYFQLRLPAPLVNTNPQPVAENPAAAAPRAAPVQAVAPAQAALPGLPTGPGVRAPAQAAKPAPQATATPAARPSTTPAIPRDPPARRLEPSARAVSAAERAPEAASLASSRPAPRVLPRVAAGYAAYQAGNLEGARNDYQQALREEPDNRDALLGLAAVETRSQRYEIAGDLYDRLLQADPRDPHATAGLLSLRGQGADPVALESRLKTLLASDPESGVLQFALGNLYVQQRRWADAQQSYFRAMAAEPGNPDYAYNLAVSLEHLRQPVPALDYYRRALSLAQGRNASFDPAAVRERVQQLSR
jgi:tetratricopeptide (TPR) repeat protein